jgi:hypothetical protein
MSDTSPRLPQPKIILEGTHLTRKTDVAFVLAEHPLIIGERRRRWHIPLLSSEWETRSDKRQTKAEPGWSMIDYPPADEAWAQSAYDAYVRLLELHRNYYWIIDRFHVSTMAYQRLEHHHEANLAWVDKRLAALGFVVVHLRRESSTFGAARKHRLTYSESPARYNDLDRFIEEQALMAELIEHSGLPSTTVDVSNGDVDCIAQTILDWVRDIDAFWHT